MISEICLYDLTILQQRPSNIAAAIYSYAHAILNHDFYWTPELIIASGHQSFEDIANTIEDIQCFVSEINPRFSKIVYDKYQRPWYAPGLVGNF